MQSLVGGRRVGFFRGVNLLFSTGFIYLTVEYDVIFFKWSDFCAESGWWQAGGVLLGVNLQPQPFWNPVFEASEGLWQQDRSHKSPFFPHVCLLRRISVVFIHLVPLNGEESAHAGGKRCRGLRPQRWWVVKTPQSVSSRWGIFKQNEARRWNTRLNCSLRGYSQRQTNTHNTPCRHFPPTCR